MELVPREEWTGPARMDPGMLDAVIIPGNKWFRLSPGVDFSTRVPFDNIRTSLYRAAARRGYRVALYREPEGSIMVYSTKLY